MSGLAAIVARDAACGGPLPDSALPEYQALADRRALLALLREARHGLVVLHSPHFGWGCNPANCSGQAALEHTSALGEEV